MGLADNRPPPPPAGGPPPTPPPPGGGGGPLADNHPTPGSCSALADPSPTGRGGAIGLPPNCNRPVAHSFSGGRNLNISAFSNLADASPIRSKLSTIVSFRTGSVASNFTFLVSIQNTCGLNTLS